MSDTVITDGTDAFFAAMAAGDQSAFQALYAAHADWVFTITLRILRDRTAAEDAAQDTFVKIWRNAGRFDSRYGSVKAWIGMIARNCALDMIRKQKPVEDLNEGEALLIATEPATPPDMKLDRCLGQLPQEQAKAITTMYTYGMSHSELSDHLKAPVGTVKSWVRRGTQALKHCMDT